MSEQCGRAIGCCPNPCGSVFDGYTPSCTTPSCTTGGHCSGCSSALPALSDPFQDDPLPPKPTSEPGTEVRHAPTQRTRTVSSAGPGVSAGMHKQPATQPKAQKPAVAATAAPQSPYKIVSTPAAPARTQTVKRPTTASPREATTTESGTMKSVIRRASAERAPAEPAGLWIDESAEPIVRSQTPDVADYYATPANPLRK
jgi:hypothetical protein